MSAIIQLIKNNVIYIENPLEKSFECDQKINSTLLENINASINLAKIPYLSDDKFEDNVTVKELYNEIKKIYSDLIPEQHKNLLNYIVTEYHAKDIQHDNHFYVARYAVPNLANAQYSIATKDLDVSAFFEGFLSKERGERLIFCTELTYQSLKKEIDDLKQKVCFKIS